MAASPKLPASRVSFKTERKLRVFVDDAYLSLDLQEKILTVIRKRADPPRASCRLPSRNRASIRAIALKAGDRVVPELHPHGQAARRGREARACSS